MRGLRIILSRKVGFFAGTFDPIHAGHLEIMHRAVTEAHLDTLYVLVEAEPWGEKQPADVSDRIAMVDLAIDAHDGIERLEVRQKRFTVAESLLELERAFVGDELLFVVGADVFMRMNLRQWQGLEQFLRHTIIVFERRDDTKEAIVQHADEIGATVVVLSQTSQHFSSGHIREGTDGHERAVPKAVDEYIRNHRLYGR